MQTVVSCAVPELVNDFHIQVDVWEPLPFVIYGIFGVASGALMLIMPETKGHGLSQTIEEAVQTHRWETTATTPKRFLFSVLFSDYLALLEFFMQNRSDFCSSKFFLKF